MPEKSNSNMTTIEKINAAFERVAIRVLERARHTKTPIVVWEDGKIKQLSPEEVDQRSQNQSMTNDK